MFVASWTTYSFRGAKMKTDGLDTLTILLEHIYLINTCT